MGTFQALRRPINNLTSVLYQLHPSGMGDTTQVIVVPSASPQHQLGENHISSLTSTKRPFNKMTSKKKKKEGMESSSLSTQPSKALKIQDFLQRRSIFKLKPDPVPIA